ncbi:MAG TPA: hypothetical protein VIV11_27475 [Kofleriaceae bacterium]
MKRMIVIALLLASVSPASSRRVVHIPTIGELCPGSAEWDKVATCIRRQSPFKLARDEVGVKLVQIAEGSRFAGLYIYTLDKQWKLQGEMRLYQAHDLLQFERVTMGKRTGFRLDVGTAMPSAISVDGETSMPAVFRYKLTSLCFVNSYCMQMNTACDVLVRGKAMYSFRGEVVHEGGKIKVVGDRSNTGAYCQQPELVGSD